MPQTDFSDATATPIRFPYGLPGFEQERRFRLVEHPGLAPLVLLQSEESADLCFVTLPVAALAPDYELPVAESDCEILGLDPSAPGEAAPALLGLAIVTVPEDGPPSANLLAPVVVNLAAGLGVQAVRADRRYSHQHPIGDVWPEDAPCL